MKLDNLQPAKGSIHKVKRIGRGTGSGHGETATKGTKGQMQRSGRKHKNYFEGGQTPLHRRFPQRGFNNPLKVIFQTVNISDLMKDNIQEEVSPEILYNVGLISKKRLPIKILGDGEISKSLTVKANAFSKSAIEKIEKSGGKIEVI